MTTTIAPTSLEQDVTEVIESLGEDAVCETEDGNSASATFGHTDCTEPDVLICAEHAEVVRLWLALLDTTHCKDCGKPVHSDAWHVRPI